MLMPQVIAEARCIFVAGLLNQVAICLQALGFGAAQSAIAGVRMKEWIGQAHRVAAIARPSIIGRMRHHSCADAIEFDTAIEVQQMFVVGDQV
jgi:hypothetical protein